MGFQRKFCLARVFLNDAIHNQFVLDVSDVGTCKPIQLRKGASIVLRGVPDALHKFFEHSIVGSGVGQQVKFSVETQEAFDVGCFFNLVRQLGESLNLNTREVRDAVRNQKRLESFPHEIRFVTFALGQLRNPCSGIRFQRDESVALKEAKSIANRLTTCSETFSNLFLNDSFTWGECSVENFFAQGRGYCAGWAGCHNVTFASFSYAFPFG